MYKIAFDVMGSDNGATIAVKAAIEFLADKNDLVLVFVGNEEQIKAAIEENGGLDKSKYEILATTEVIDMNGSIMDVRRKKDSSLVRTLELVKEGKVDGMLTGGNSAAFIAGSHFILGEFEGVTRPGFMPTLPTVKAGITTLLLDAGANTENDPEDLLGYAKMATIYASEIQGIKNPRVGLMNIGAEEGKGKDLQKQTYKLLKEDESINFLGNIETRDMVAGDVDILVTDGFTGNIALKAVEGMAKNIMSEIKESITKTFFRKINALFLKPAFKEVGNKFDYKNHAGAILIGVNGIAFKSHGSSDVKSFKATLRMTYSAVQNDVLNKMKKGMDK
ncbi:phosphate acyltransferase PlsX [[Acholeplasma] multilocale]|uniref:phosphate acyltransferase PlsX n=1 Tax=[Acholeplasma] multilocale TaxID=264638 RepID=UPI0003FAC087|nr:phosphate acyltransferase PlsX [[Acholeplasma] multilocale]